MTRKPAIYGAVLGLAAYLWMALVPSLLYGGCAGVMLAGGLLGIPLGSALAARGVVLVGMAAAVVLGAGLAAATGAALATWTTALVRAAPARRPAGDGA